MAVLTVAMMFLPHGDSLPKGCPAADLWEFRPAAIGIQAVLRTAFGLFCGYLAERVLAPSLSQGRLQAQAV